MNRRPPGRVHLSLMADAASDYLARRFASEALRSWGVDGDAEDLLLVVSELVTNAIRHTHEVSTLHLILRPGLIRIEVEDMSPELPTPRSGGPNGGWGLGLVQKLTSSWGTRPSPRGKVVWCEMPLPSGLRHNTEGLV